MKKAIIYGRVSTSKQSTESIETQIAECKKWAEKNNCEIVEIYDDSGQSGRSYNVGNRDGFQQIKEDAKNGRMDFALIHKIDRFARSVKDYFGQESEIEKYGVKLIVVSMPFLENADIITKSVHIAMAEQFSTNLSDEVSTKMRTFARKGMYLGSPAPYGYDYKEIDGVKTLVPNPEQAQGVKFIYETYLKGYGYISTSKIAAKNGYVNNAGNPFTHTYIKNILENKRYNGFYVYGLRNNQNGKVVWQKDKEKIIEIPNAHEKIIDDETFNAVQEKIASKGCKNKIRKRVYPLTGKLKCGLCGRPLTGYASSKTPNPNNIDYNYYRCTGNRVLGCKLKSVRAYKIEDYIFEKIKTYVFNDEFVETLIKEVQAHLIGDVSSVKKLKTQIEKEIKSINGEIKAATREKFKHKIDDDLYEEIVDDLTNEKQTLESRLKNVSRQLEVEGKTAEIRKYIETLKNNMETTDKDVKNAVLQQVVRSIVVYPDKIDVFLNLSQTPPPPNKGGNFFVLDNINTGVPVFNIDKLNVYAENGDELINFDFPHNEYKK